MKFLKVIQIIQKKNKQKPGRPKKIEKAQINQKDISDYFINENKKLYRKIPS